MEQTNFCFICLVEGKKEGTDKRGRRRKQLCINITKRESTEMREEALIALGEDSFWKDYGPVARYATEWKNDIWTGVHSSPSTQIFVCQYNPTHFLRNEFFPSLLQEKNGSKIQEWLKCALLWVINCSMVTLLVRLVRENSSISLIKINCAKRTFETP